MRPLHQQDVDGPQVAGDGDRRLQGGLPQPAGTCDEGGDVPRLARVTEPAANGVWTTSLRPTTAACDASLSPVRRRDRPSSRREISDAETPIAPPTWDWVKFST